MLRLAALPPETYDSSNEDAVHKVGRRRPHTARVDRDGNNIGNNLLAGSGRDPDMSGQLAREST